MSDIQWFFEGDVSEGRQSTLAHGLKELSRMEESGMSNSQAYCMYLWAVLDLLSRFASGQLDNQRATKRLKTYLQEYFPHKRSDTQILLLFRNACAHSVSGYASDAGGNVEMRFTLVDDGPFLEKRGRSKVEINPKEFRPRLDRSIEKYRVELEKSEQLKARFEKVFTKLGYVKL